MHLAHKNLTKLIYFLIFLATIISISLLPSLSHATVQSEQLPYAVVPQEIKANSDNSLSYYHCRTHAYNYGSLKYFGRSFDGVHNAYIDTRTIVNRVTVINPYISECSATSGYGKDYTLTDDGSTIGNFHLITKTGKTYDALARHKDGEFIWEKTVNIECTDDSTKEVGITTPIQGYDGNIYGIVRNDCNQSGHSLVGVNTHDGTLRFSINMNINTDHGRFRHGPYLGTYDQGLVLLDNNKLRYFDYNGLEEVSLSQDVPSIGTLYTAKITVDNKGNAYVRYIENFSQHHLPCSSNGLGMEKIFFNNLEDEVSGTIDLDSCNEYAPISQVSADPTGGMVILTEKRDGDNRHYVVRYDKEGNLKNSATVAGEVGYTTLTRASKLNIDDNGNIIIARDMRKTSGDGDRHVMSYKITSSGSVSKIFSTQQFDIEGQYQNFNLSSSSGLGLYDGKLHIGVCQGICTHTNPSYIYTVTDLSLGGAYPENLIGSMIVDHDIDDDNDGLTKWQEIQQGTSDDNADSDGDGLNDFLESRWNPDRHDLFCNGNRSICEYPNPAEKDIYVEVDWMTRPAEGSIDSYTTKPSEDQIDEIKEAFANKGIHAHFDTGQLGGGNEVPYNRVVKFDVIPGEVDFYDYKKGGDGISANFSPDRYQIYHYMLSGYRYNDTSPANSGIALVSDDDFFVAFGSLKEDFGFILPGSTEKAITGTIIHELGHNLCLTGNTHDDPTCSFEGIDDNYGNSYPSVMNYDKQFNLIDYSTGQNGSGDHDDWNALRLHDFASSNLGDEAHDLLQSMQQQSMRMRAPLELQPQYRELQNKLREFERSIEQHE